MSPSHGSMSCSVVPLCTGLINTLLGPARFRNSLTLPLAFGDQRKLLYHLDVSSTPSGTFICCFCNLSSSTLRGSCSACTILLGIPDMAGWHPLPANQTYPPNNLCIKITELVCILIFNTLLAVLSVALFVWDLKSCGMFVFFIRCIHFACLTQ